MNPKILTLLQIIPKERNCYHNFGKYAIWNGETTTFLEYKVGYLTTVLALIDRRSGTIAWTSHVKEKEQKETFDKFLEVFST